MLRIFLTAAAIVIALVVIKQDHVMQRAGLASFCESVAPPAGRDGEWHACHPGRLAGRPDLTRDSCTAEGFAGKIEYWRCPAAVGSGLAASR